MSGEKPASDIPSILDTPYDRVPYKSYPFRQSHPERLATIAKLHGIDAPRLTNCRVLEIGCASGGNLLPMADRFSESEFIGIDLSSAQVAAGNKVVEESGLQNVRLIHGDIRSMPDDLGDFDYIVAHGVFSWIPTDAQTALLDVCGNQLTENGIAYVSYNTFPGWRMRGMIRDIMGYHTRKSGKPEDQVRKARALLNFLAESVPTEGNPYGLLLNSELEQLRDKEDYYLIHEHLEDVNDPIYFSEFAERAERAGLQYLGEADFSVMAVENFSPSVAAMLNSLSENIIEREQYMDFVRNRMFRQTLLCRSGLTIDRNLSPLRLRELHVCSNTKPSEPIRSLRDNSPATFESGASVTKTTDPIVKAALAHLGAIWPSYISFGRLVAMAKSIIADQPSIVDTAGASIEAERLGKSLLRCYATGHVELSVEPAKYETIPSENSGVSQLIRQQARQQKGVVTNLRHETVHLTDIEQRLLVKLDGVTTVNELISEVCQLMDRGLLIAHQNGEPVLDPAIQGNIANDVVKRALERFAKMALLTPRAS
jgi:methyltransferase-like protein/2-polyprenyl-3-methyl-5-hydroxy-6-metoxy-1,4-benzoquinol methylase